MSLRDRPPAQRPWPKQPPRTVALWVRGDRPEAIEAAREAASMMRAEGLEVRAEASTAARLDLPGGPLEEVLAEADLALVLGGDGAVVLVARAAAQRGVPVVGVNFGTFGFLAEIEASQLADGVRAICDGCYEVDGRLMLSAVVNGGPELYAANDVAVKASDPGHILELRVSLGRDLIAEFAADGLVVATATGSTAYNLSAGGPVVMPGVPAMVMTPICPHTLATRPLVLHADAELVVEVVDLPRMSHSAVVSIDGQIDCQLAPGTPLLLRRAPVTLPLARLEHRAFFNSLRGKLGWGLPR